MPTPTEYLIVDSKDLSVFFAGTYASFEDCYGGAEANGDPELELKFIVALFKTMKLDGLSVYAKRA